MRPHFHLSQGPKRPSSVSEVGESWCWQVTTGTGVIDKTQTHGGGQRRPLRWLGREAAGGRCGEVPGELLACLDFLRPQPKNGVLSPHQGPELSSHHAGLASTKQAAEPTDQIGAIISVHSPVKCSNKNLWTLASCFNFFFFWGRKSVRCPIMEFREQKKKKGRIEGRNRKI